MKIIHIIIGLNVGGAEAMLKRLIESAPDNMHDVVVSLTSLGIIGESLRAQGVIVHTLNMTSALEFPLVLWRLVRLVQSYQPEIVQTWMYHADLLGGLAARIAGVRCVIWGIRTTDIHTDGLSATIVVRWLCARLSRWIPDAIICAAEASKNSHILIGYDPKKMQVIPNGYNFSWLTASFKERQTLREQYGVLHDELVLGCLGRFHADKDQENFVFAASLLIPLFPKLRFLMVGRGLDWNNAQLVDWIALSGDKNRFILLGERTDVPVCLSAMDIFCLPSRTEGFPNVLAEAMAIGLPCITTDVGDAALLLANTGVVVPRSDAEALARGVKYMLELGANERSDFGRRAKHRVEAEFSMTRARDRFEEIYRQILANRTV